MVHNTGTHSVQSGVSKILKYLCYIELASPRGGETNSSSNACFSLTSCKSMAFLAYSATDICYWQETTLAKIPNLHSRQGTYYLRREIPADLKSVYSPKKEIWRSL